ncbi:hypothetical protein [Verrucomicrobium spinosum]|uniref:hypothetical protein n=1 Tax=Verrucomicrobium spinosum TaxID=2736 RepID=UPI000A762BEB|nr:hypothetical protein [Verrucomicrobium spinosum]
MASGATLSYALTGAGNVDENIHLLGGTLAVAGAGDATFRTILGLTADSTIQVAAGRSAIFNTASSIIAGMEADGTLADITVQGGGTATFQSASNFGDLLIKGNSVVNIGNNTAGNVGAGVTTTTVPWARFPLKPGLRCSCAGTSTAHSTISLAERAASHSCRIPTT